MAAVKKNPTVEEMRQQSAALSKREEQLLSETEASPSFWKDTTPTRKDVLNDIQLRDIKKREEKLKSNMIARDMYGLTTDQDVSEVSQPKESALMQGIDILSRPLYGLVGAASYVAGKGQSTLGGSVMDSIKNRETWGGLLRKTGVNPKVSMPMGFALDVITDPVNLLSGGWTGFTRTGIGKIGKGAVKAGIEGAATGAKLSGLKLFNRVASLVPGIGVEKQMAKAIKELAEKGVAQNSPEFADAIARVYKPTEGFASKVMGKARIGKENLEQAIQKTSERYDELTNFDLKRVLENRAVRQSVMDKAVKTVEESGPAGQKIMEAFSYDPYKHTQAQTGMENVVADFKKEGVLIQRKWNKELNRYEAPTFEETMAQVKKAREQANMSAVDSVRPDVENLTKPEAVQGYKKLIDDSMEMMEKGDKVNFPSSLESVDAMNQEARLQSLWIKYNNALKEVMSQEKLSIVDNINKAIVKNIGRAIKDPKRVQAILDGYDIYRGLFVKSKITSLSPSSLTYAILGNPTMNLMYGFNPFHPDNFARMNDAISVVLGNNKARAAEVFDWMITDPKMIAMWEKSSERFKDVFGLDLENLARDVDAKNYLSKFKNLSALEKAKVTSDVEQNIIGNVVKNSKSETFATGASQFYEGGLTGMSNLAKNVEKAAKESTGVKQLAAKATNWYFNRSKDFQKVDQAFKLKDFFRMVRDGIPEKELLKITNNSLATNARIFPEDIIESAWRGGEKYFKLSPSKAMEIASDVYMNYAAMPAFIKVLRGLPIVGSPFFAFTYAMMGKTGKAALNNPAAFNKVNFLLQELSQDKSPIEREALKSKYYSYLDKPGMVNLGEDMPFFRGRQIYLNLAQMVPYYSLNIINPSERGFNDDIRGKFAAGIDRSPLFKDPIGQMLLDYIILPAIIQDQAPVNMWGGPLYEKGASNLQKASYMVRSVGESLTPSFPSTVAASMPGWTPEQLKWFPNYQGRKAGFAVRGMTAVGVTSGEDPASRGLRAWLSTIGVNLYPIDLVNVSTQLKAKKQQ
jgi:hypothetical protein